MKKSIQSVFLAFVFLMVLLSGCAPASTPVPPTFTPSLIPPTFTPEPTATATATATAVPATATAASPYTYVDIGSPYAKDCGDGIPIMTCDISFNGIDYGNRYGHYYGHVDISPPIGCDINSYKGEIVASVPGILSGNKSGSYDLKMPKYILINGMDKVLAEVGVTDFNPDMVDFASLDIGHVKLLRDLPKGGSLDQGRSIGDLVPTYGDKGLKGTVFAMQVYIRYDQRTYIFSPSMFLIATGKPPWECVSDPQRPDPRDCELEYNHYP
jgi:hypothetical protein